MTTGVFNTTQFTAANVQPSFASNLIKYNYAGSAPLLAISGMLPKKSCINTTHSYFARSGLWQQMTTTAELAAAGTALVVSSTTDIIAGGIYQVDSTQENVYVVSVDSTTQVTISRGIGTVAAAVIPSGAILYLVGTAFEEGSTRPTAVKVNEVQVSNYTQIFRNAWALTGTAAAIQKYVGVDATTDGRQQCAAAHALDIERALIMGQKYSGTLNGRPFRTMQGVVDNCRANSRITAMSSTTTYDQLETALDPVFNITTEPKGTTQRVLFVGGTARKVINNIGRLSGECNLSPESTDFGMQFQTFKTSRGTFTMIEHPLFNSNVLWTKYALCVDLAGISVPYLGGRDTKPEEYALDAQGNVRTGEYGVDAKGGGLLSELTMELTNPYSNMLLTNLTLAAA